jgi:hypothetical protein
LDSYRHVFLVDGTQGKEIGNKNQNQKNMKIYIAGKISGLPKSEYTAKFLQAELALRAAGYEPVNPCTFGIADNAPLHEALPVCKPHFDQCQAVYLLSDWEDSQGAIMEKSWAIHQGMKIYLERKHPYELMQKMMEDAA